MKDIDRHIQQELLHSNKDLFYIALYGCGGIIFLKHFYELLGHKDSSILQKMQNYKLITLKKIGKNQVVVLKHAVFCYFQLPNKSVKLTSRKLVRSAILCEMILHTYKYKELSKVRQMLELSNLCYFKPRQSYYILNRINEFFKNMGIGDLTYIRYSIAELDEKTTAIETSRIGSKSTFATKVVKSDDLIILKSSDIYIRDLDYQSENLHIYVAIFITALTSDKIARAISKAENCILYSMYGIDTVIHFDLYSLEQELPKVEERVMKTIIKKNPIKQDEYTKTVKFHWYNCKNKLFSGINIDKWL